MALTVGLLVLGLLGTLLGVVTAAGLEFSLRQQYELADLGPYTAPESLPGIQLTIVISHIVLFLAALGLAVPRLVAGRLAFWVPLAAGVVAALVFWACMVAVIVGDPTLLDAYQPAG